MLLVDVGGVIKAGRGLLKGLEHKIDVSHNPPIPFPKPAQELAQSAHELDF